jgi:ribosome recycling factor
VDLKGKARGLGTKAREDVREFRRDFKEELRRKNDDEAE